MIAELMPTNSPRKLISAPPELPGLIDASVWNEVLVPVAADSGAAQCTYDARGDRVAETERVADSEDEVADAYAFRIAYRHVGQPLRVYLDNRDVRRGIRANDLGIEDFAVHRRDLNLVCVLDDVVICNDIAVVGIDDDAGTGTRDLAAAATTGAVRQTEEASKSLIAEMAAHIYGLADANVDDGGRYPLDEWRQAGQCLIVDHCRQRGPGCRTQYQQQANV